MPKKYSLNERIRRVKAQKNRTMLDMEGSLKIIGDESPKVRAHRKAQASLRTVLGKKKKVKYW